MEWTRPDYREPRFAVCEAGRTTQWDAVVIDRERFTDSRREWYLVVACGTAEACEAAKRLLDMPSAWIA